MKQNFKLIVIIPEFLSQGVVEAQIFDFFDNLKGVNVIYIAITKIKSNKTNLFHIKKYSDISYYIKKYNPDYIYIRSALQYWKLRFQTIKYRVKVIYSFRALVFVERYFKSGSYLRATVLFLAELGVYATAHTLTTVTFELKKKLKKYFLFQRKCLVIPCYCATKFDKTPNLTEEIRMVYVGGSSVWQCTDEMFELFSELAKLLPCVSLTVYSNDVDFFNSKISALSYEDQQKITVCNVSRSQLIKELTRYDIGFLLRHDYVVNRVASPIKFYEYVAAGVIPLITPYVGDIAKDSRVATFSLVYDFNVLSLQYLVDSIKDYMTNRDLYRQSMADFEREADINLGLQQFQTILKK